jgi:hypothetical protein
MDADAPGRDETSLIDNIFVIASEAKQSSGCCRKKGLDCVVASLLAMTIQPNPASGRGQILVGQTNSRALGVARAAEQSAIQPKERRGRCKEAVAGTVAHHDSGGLRRYFDNKGV